jgi:hypothetical protein
MLIEKRIIIIISFFLYFDLIICEVFVYSSPELLYGDSISNNNLNKCDRITIQNQTHRHLNKRYSFILAYYFTLQKIMLVEKILILFPCVLISLFVKYYCIPLKTMLKTRLLFHLKQNA